MRRSAWITIFGALTAQVAISSTAQAGPNDAILVGVVKDVSTGEAVEGAVVVPERREPLRNQFRPVREPVPGAQRSSTPCAPTPPR